MFENFDRDMKAMSERFDVILEQMNRDIDKVIDYVVNNKFFNSYINAE